MRTSMLAFAVVTAAGACNRAPASFESAAAVANVCTIDVAINPALSPLLVFPGNRQASFANAVNAWNVALAAAGSTLRLIDKSPSPLFAAPQGFVPNPPCNLAACCLDPAGNPVFLSGARTGNPVASTGQDTAPAGANHGYVRKANGPLPMGSIDPWDIDLILADTVGGTANILWYTHGGPTGAMQTCNLIPWSYGGAVGPGSIDFPSVMTHELGHTIGLPDNGVPGSVMEGTIQAGKTLMVTPADAAAAAALPKWANCKPEMP